MYVYALYTIFQCEFNCNSDYVIRTLHFENIWYGHHQASFFGVNSTVTVIMSSGHYILKIYDMGIIRHHFSVWIQLQQWLCHLDTVFENIWYGHHQTSFFSVNSAVMVIMSSGHYIWKNMIWPSSGIVFQCEFSCNSDDVIWTLYLKKYDTVIIRHHFSVWIQL